MTDTTVTARVARRSRHEAIRAAVAVEEAEAAEAEAGEKATALDVPMHRRIDRDLDERLRQRASGEGIPTSALVRRLLRQAVQQGSTALSQADGEEIARRVARADPEPGRALWRRGLGSGDCSMRSSAHG